MLRASGCERLTKLTGICDEQGVLFYEYFHGDNGAGLGASHQTGWTGLVGSLINLFGQLDPARILSEGRTAAFKRSSTKAAS